MVRETNSSSGEANMKYLALVYYDEAIIDAMSKKEWDALNAECYHCVQGLKSSGHYVDGAPLHPVATGTTVRVREGKANVTDGPFAETREQLAGFYMLEARDLNEALSLAADRKSTRLNSSHVKISY